MYFARHRKRCVSLSLALMLLGGGLQSCKEREDVLDEPFTVSGPIVVGRHLAYLDQTLERVTLVRPLTREIRNIPVGKNPSFMLPGPDHDKLLVLSRGWIATTSDEDDEEPTLHIIDPDSGDLEVHTLGSPFDNVALSDDNQYAVAFFSADANPSETEVFRNPNTVAILEMATGEIDEKNVRSFGDVPRGVVFSPSTMAPINADGTLGAPRTLAVVFAEGYVTLLDVTHPERREVTIRLALPGMTESVFVPQQLVFAPSAGTAYLRASGTNDIYVLSLTTREPTEPDENDFVVSINTLAAGTVPSDVALFLDDGEYKVLVANQQSMDITVIDALTAEFKTIDVGDPVDRILVYPEVAPEVAILFCQASPRKSIYFLDLASIEESGGRSLTRLDGVQPIRSIEIIPGRGQALVIHDDTRSVMSVLDLHERTLSPFTGQSGLGDYAFNASGEVFSGHTYSQNLGIVDLDTLSARTVVIEHAPSQVLTLEVGRGSSTDAELRAVIVDHGEAFGLITVLPNPLEDTADTTFVLRGFLLTDIFDQDLSD